MARTTFSGPVSVGNRDQGAGTLVASRTLAIVPLATANTDFVLFQPAGQRLRVLHQTSTAFTGATATIQVGTTVGGAELVAAADIKAALLTNLTLLSLAANADMTLYVRLVQTTPTAVGVGRLHIEYIPS